MTPTITTLAMAMLAGASHAADPVALRVTTGLPQVRATTDGASMLRYVTARMDVGLVGVEARMSDCRGPVAPTWTPSAVGCADASGGPAAAGSSQQYAVRVGTPTFTGAPTASLTLRNWRSRGLAADAGPSKGSSADVELTQALGPAKAYAGYSTPVGRVAPTEDWRTTYAGVKWSPGPRHAMEVAAEESRPLMGGAREREARVAYAYTRSAAARWRVSLARAVDDRTDPWRAGLGLDWTF